MNTIDVMYEDGNQNVRLKQRLDNRGGLFRRGSLSTEEYRLSSAMADDMEVYAVASGGGLQALPDHSGYVVMPSAKGVCSAPQTRSEAPCWRLGRSRDAVGAPVAWNLLETWLRYDPPLRLMEDRLRKRHGWALPVLTWALERIGEAQIYDQVQWRQVIRAEHPAASA